MRHVLITCGFLLATVGALRAADAQPARPLADPAELVTPELVRQIRAWATAPVVRVGLEGRNARQGELAQDRIDALDAQWRRERGEALQPLITSVLTGPVSTYLTRIQAGSIGLFTEIFVMDRNGLNVGQSAITSDYWQGDEAKFQRTFEVGAGALFLDEPEYHEETATWRAQLNMTIEDADDAPIGAITVEINLTELDRRRLAGLQR